MNLSERSTGPHPAGDQPSGPEDLDQLLDATRVTPIAFTLGLLFPRLVKGPYVSYL